MSVLELLHTIPSPDTDAAQKAQLRQDRLTKPTGSLGRLEDLSVRIAGMTGRPIPTIDPVVIFVFAADHGVAARGVSAYPAEVTPQMVLNYVRGGAVINTLARLAGAKLCVADVGVAADFPSELPITHCKVRRGTADWSRQPAMKLEEAVAAMQAGCDMFQVEMPVGLAVMGEMGIGNTATAAALVSYLLGVDPALVTGRGTGLDPAGIAAKAAVVREGVERLPTELPPLHVLAELGGLEIAAMAGAIIAAASARVPVLLDGFISTCAGLVASRLAPGTEHYLISGHRSPESGHTVVLEALGLSPLLDLEMRLGEGSGAALAVPLVRASVDVLAHVATFDEAGVSDSHGL